MKKYLFIILIFIVGCSDPFDPELKCINEVVYFKRKDVWIEHLNFKFNKCFEVGAKP